MFLVYISLVYSTERQFKMERLNQQIRALTLVFHLIVKGKHIN